MLQFSSNHTEIDALRLKRGEFSIADVPNILITYQSTVELFFNKNLSVDFSSLLYLRSTIISAFHEYLVKRRVEEISITRFRSIFKHFSTLQILEDLRNHDVTYSMHEDGLRIHRNTRDYTGRVIRRLNTTGQIIAAKRNRD